MRDKVGTLIHTTNRTSPQGESAVCETLFLQHPLTTALLWGTKREQTLVERGEVDVLLRSFSVEVGRNSPSHPSPKVGFPRERAPSGDEAPEEGGAVKKENTKG